MARIAARVLTLGTVEEIEQCLLDAFGRAGIRNDGDDRMNETCSVTRVEKPWGYELHWAKTERYVGKILHIKAGHALSLQYHNMKDETIYVYCGRMLFEIGRGGQLEKREMRPGDSVHVTPKTVHRMTAIEDCDVLEVSTPELDDVVRLEDRYGRVRKP